MSERTPLQHIINVFMVWAFIAVVVALLRLLFVIFEAKAVAIIVVVLVFSFFIDTMINDDDPW